MILSKFNLIFLKKKHNSKTMLFGFFLKKKHNPPMSLIYQTPNTIMFNNPSIFKNNFSSYIYFYLQISPCLNFLFSSYTLQKL